MSGRIKNIEGPQTNSRLVLGASEKNKFAPNWDVEPGLGNAIRRVEVRAEMGQRITHRGKKPVFRKRSAS